MACTNLSIGSEALPIGGIEPMLEAFPGHQSNDLGRENKETSHWSQTEQHTDFAI